MLRGGEGARRGPRIDRMGGLVLAMIVGVLVPPLVVSLVASRDPLPRSCGAGQVSATRLDGAILHTTGADLWYSEGIPGQPRKLVDFAPPPARPSAGETPSPDATPSASAAPAPAPASSASPSPGATSAGAPRVVAADIAADRRLVAFVVIDPPDRPGFISLRLMSPLDPPGKAPAEVWFTHPDRQPRQAPVVRVLEDNKVLVIASVPRALLPEPSPAISAPASPSPSAVPSPAITPIASPSTAPSPPPSPSPNGAVVIVVDPVTAHFAAIAPLEYFLDVAHSQWPDTRTYRVAGSLPAVDSRVEGPLAGVAGTAQRVVGTPLTQRQLNQVVLGRSGRRNTNVVCAAGAGISPIAFSPDESGLALYDGRETLYLDLGGTHAATRLLDGKILSWRG